MEYKSSYLSHEGAREIIHTREGRASPKSRFVTFDSLDEGRVYGGSDNPIPGIDGATFDVFGGYAAAIALKGGGLGLKPVRTGDRTEPDILVRMPSRYRHAVLYIDNRDGPTDVTFGVCMGMPDRTGYVVVYESIREAGKFLVPMPRKFPPSYFPFSEYGFGYRHSKGDSALIGIIFLDESEVEGAVANAASEITKAVMSAATRIVDHANR
ncbi:MAG: hypothetical protein WBW32_10630 [Luteibacter sp.]